MLQILVWSSVIILLFQFCGPTCNVCTSGLESSMQLFRYVSVSTYKSGCLVYMHRLSCRFNSRSIQPQRENRWTCRHNFGQLMLHWLLVNSYIFILRKTPPKRFIRVISKNIFWRMKLITESTTVLVRRCWGTRSSNSLVF